MTNRSRVCCATVTPFGSVVRAKLQAFGGQSRRQSLNYATGAPAHSQKCRSARLHGETGILWRVCGAPKGTATRTENVAGGQEHDGSGTASRRGEGLRASRSRRRGFFMRIEVVVRGS